MMFMKFPNPLNRNRRKFFIAKAGDVPALIVNI